MAEQEQVDPTPQGKARAEFFVTDMHSIFFYLTSVRATLLLCI